MLTRDTSVGTWGAACACAEPNASLSPLVCPLGGRCAALFWSPARMPEGLELLARRAGLLHPSLPTRPLARESPPALEDPAFPSWVLVAAEQIGVEAEPVKETHARLAASLRTLGPCVWTVSLSTGSRCLLLLPQRRSLGASHTVTLLDTDGHSRDVPVTWLARLLGRGAPVDALAATQQVLADAGLSKARQRAVLRTVADDALANRFVDGGILLRPHPAASFAWQARRAGALRTALSGVIAHALQYALFLAAWAVFGKATVEGWLDGSWLWACGLLLASCIPLRLMASSASGRLTLGLGCLLKQRLLYGTLRLDPDAVRQQGAGELFARTVEAERIESLALSGGIAVVLAAIELGFVAFILFHGAAPLQLLVLALLLAAVAAAGVRAFRRRSTWMSHRLTLTGDLVERMAGHRTRLAQQRPGHWHDGEDAALSRYLESSMQVDRSTVEATAWLGRAFLPLALVALAPVLLAPGELITVAVAVSLGGMLLGEQSFGRLTHGLFSLVDAAVAWRAVAPMFRAGAALPASPAGCEDVPAAEAPASERGLVEMRGVTFARPGRLVPVLKDCHLSIGDGEHILLEGPSGGGKSTLTALLGCQRDPTAGLLLLRGLDRHTLGAAAWRRAVACAPQFHENHVLSGTFAYNALLGRGWPASQASLQEVDEVCRELGLGPLLDRMPAGLDQMVGASGWRLSHGEQSRLFLARALLQGGALVLLDETFAALDPENLERALLCAQRRCQTLVVVAHP